MKFTELRADKKLGRSFAGLLCFVEGLHVMGFLGDRDYENYRKRYSTPLDKDPEQVALMEVTEANRRKDLNNTFRNIIEAYSLHKHQPKWVAYWREKAMKAPDLPNAVRLLAVIEEGRS